MIYCLATHEITVY